MSRPYLSGICRRAMQNGVAAFLVGCLAACSMAGTATVTVDAGKPGAKISPMLWGIFFEDINLSADGGIYAELVRNRSFEESEKPEYWSLVTSGSAKADMAIDQTKPLNPLNRRSLRVRISEAGEGKVGLVNGGYWGMNIVKDAEYRLSFAARCADGFAGPLAVMLEDQTGKTLAAKASVEGVGANWKTFTIDFKATEGNPQARLVISAAQKGTLFLDMVSLFPKKTWKDRANGLRPDLAEMLVGLKPSFVRFPGGCWVEGDDMAHFYRWKETIGDVSQRKPLWNIWGYNATHGIGYLEYLIMCEDLGAEPLWVVNCGMSHRENVPMDQMAAMVQDALDSIEYANGSVDTVWGALRARHGHPKPFNLRYIEIGNENGGPAYQERYALFHDAIRAKYPNMILVADEPTRSRPADIVDEHYYSNPEFFIHQAGKYDKYDRKGPKIYVGEYAVTQNCGLGNLAGALGEAAFMVGMERNADHVVMASYAPLFVNMNHRKWNPDLINFDSHRVYGLPSYYVQKMFSEVRGDVILPADVAAAVTAPEPVSGAVGVGTWLTQAEFKDMKVTRNGQTVFAADLANGTKGWRLHGGDWKVQDGVLRQGSSAENIRAIVGDKSWTDYVYTLKARKIAGAEGFLIPFCVKDEGGKSWWNIGGWGNSRHGIEMGGVVGNEVAGKIETGRWYDIRIEVKGAHIKCFLDDKLIHDVDMPASRAMYVAASRATASGEVILKVVNVSKEPQDTQIKLNGITGVSSTAKATVLAGEKPTDENSLAEPTKVSPVDKTIEKVGVDFRHTFPPYSVTVLRLGTQK